MFEVFVILCIVFVFLAVCRKVVVEQRRDMFGNIELVLFIASDFLSHNKCLYIISIFHIIELCISWEQYLQANKTVARDTEGRQESIGIQASGNHRGGDQNYGRLHR